MGLTHHIALLDSYMLSEWRYSKIPPETTWEAVGALSAYLVSWSQFYPLHCLLLYQEQTKVLHLMHIDLWIRFHGVPSLSHICFNKCQFPHLGFELTSSVPAVGGRFPLQHFESGINNTLLVVLHWHNWERLEHLKTVLWILICIK